MSEVSMWLFPLCIACLIGLVVGLRHGWRWTWGMCLQQAIILVFTVISFLYLYPPAFWHDGRASEPMAAFFAMLAWILFMIFNLGQRLLLNAYSLDLALFKTRQAAAKVWMVKLLAWGPTGAFWQDMGRSLGYFSENRKDEATDIVLRWSSDSRLPLDARESLIGFSMLGGILLGDWQGIITQFEQLQHLHTKTRTMVLYQMASRAYAELGRFEESFSCLAIAAVPDGKTNVIALDINFMTFFALTGAINELEKLFHAGTDKRALPQYVRLYWIGRCFAAAGDTDKSIAALEDSKRALPVELDTWCQRIDLQLSRQLAIRAGTVERPLPVARSAKIAQAGRLYKRARLILELVRPAQMKAGVSGIMIALMVSYLVSNADQLFGANQALTELHRQCYLLGQLDWNHLWRGQWWRLLSYMFLHGNTAHLLLNTGALYLFGKPVENMYGTRSFLIIYFLSGVFSGLVQVILMPHDAAIGASGAILGIFGAAIAGVFRLKNILPPQLRQAELRWMVSIAIAQAIFDQLVNTIAAATDKSGIGVRIAAFAHMGGILAGFIIAMFLPLRHFDEISDTLEPEFQDGTTIPPSNLLK